jgi:tetratricopeptide (TPR) repeat protein
MSINCLRALPAAMMCSLAGAAAFASGLGDCGHPVAHRSIPACSALIERGSASPERQAELLLLRGTAYMIKGDNDQAIKDLDEAVRLNPSDADAFFSRGGAYFKKGDYDRAMADYDQANWLNPDHLGAYVGRTDIYKRLYKTQLLDGDPASDLFGRRLYASLFEGSAETEQRSEKHWRSVEERFALLDEAIHRKPKDAEAYYKRGNAYRSLGRRHHDRALADYSEAIRLDEKHLKAYAWRATILHAKGQYDLAIADLDQVIRARPDLEWPLSNRALVHEHQGDYDRAIADLNEAIRVETSMLPPPRWGEEPHGLPFHVRRGRVYERKGERDNAIADYRKVLTSFRGRSFHDMLDSVKALKRLGADLSDFPQHDEAQEVAHLTELVQKAPTNENYWRRRCAAYNKKRQYDLAIADCNEAIRLTLALPSRGVTASLDRSGLARIYNQRGIAYRNTNDLDRAIADFDEALRLQPSTAEYYHNRGQLQAEWRDYERALDDYRLAIRLNPKVPEYYDSRGRAYELKGDREKASANFNKAREIRRASPKQYLLAPLYDW